MPLRLPLTGGSMAQHASGLFPQRKTQGPGSLVRRFDDLHSGRRHVLLWGSHPCEAQCKIRLDTTLLLYSRPRRRRLRWLEPTSGHGNLAALVELGKQLCKTRCFRKKGALQGPSHSRHLLTSLHSAVVSGSQTYCVGASSETSTPCFPKKATAQTMSIRKSTYSSMEDSTGRGSLTSAILLLSATPHKP